MNHENTSLEMNEEALSAVVTTAEADEDTEAEKAEALEAVAEDAETDDMTDAAAETAETDNETADDETAGNEINAEDEAAKPAKKKCPLQIPVIISACIVAAALLCYFVFVAFFLKEPEGVTWSTEIGDVTYYFEFNNDNTMKAYVGSIEVDSTFDKIKSEGENYLTVGASVGNFYSGIEATYEITGSRLLGNQVFSYSYGEGYDFSLKQDSRQKIVLELPADFTPDEALLGEWVFQYFGYDYYRATFNADGSMKLELLQQGATYNGTYTIEDGTINFTYNIGDNLVQPLEYSIEDDTLNLLGFTFTRVGSEVATPDQLLIAD